MKFCTLYHGLFSYPELQLTPDLVYYFCFERD